MEQSKNFTEGKILLPFIKFALPILLAIFLQTMYGAVDMLIVGRFASAADVSAVSTGSWLMQLITAFVVGIAMGLTVILGKKIGEGSKEEAGQYIGASIILFGIIGVVIIFIMELFAVPITRIMRAPKEAFVATVSYVRICSAGALFIIAYNVLGSIFRGIGNSKMPLITVAIACVCNIFGDLFLVGGLNMATSGAALATVAAQAISVIISLMIIKKLPLPFSFSKRNIKWETKKMWEIWMVGFPIALQDVLVSISFLAITAIVNGLGVIAAAGVGIAEKLCGFIMLVPSALSQAMASFVAQNVGAGKKDRANKTLRYGITLSLAVGVFMAYGAFFHGDVLAGIFTKQVQVKWAATQYLKAYAVDCMLVSIMFCMVGYFNGCEKTKFVMVQGITGAFGVRIPVSYLMSKLKPISLFKVGLATPCSTIIQIILCVWYYRYLARQEKKI